MKGAGHSMLSDDASTAETGSAGELPFAALTETSETQSRVVVG